MPMIDRAQVRYVARLARLRIPEEEEERTALELGAVLGYIERLAAVDVSSVEPLVFAGETGPRETLAGGEASNGDVGSQNVGAFRADVPWPSLPREIALAGAPQQDGQAFVVPRILE